MSRWLNYAGFQLGWFACVGGAARGWAWAGPAAAAVLVGLHLAFAPDPKRELRRLAAVNEQLVQRMRLEIHRAARRDDGTLLGDEERQKLVARAVLDTVAAVNAAIADIT